MSITNLASVKPRTGNAEPTPQGEVWRLNDSLRNADDAPARHSQECEQTDVSQKTSKTDGASQSQSVSNTWANHGKTPLAFYRGKGQFRPNREDGIWLACLIDSEGHLGLSYTNARKTTVSTLIDVSMQTKPVIERAQEIIYKITRKKPTIKERRNYKHTKSVVYCVRVFEQKSCRKVCEFILPYLIGKKEQAEIIIEYCLARKEAKHNHETHRNRPGYPHYKEHELSLIERMKVARKSVYTTPLERLETERPSAEVTNA